MGVKRPKGTTIRPVDADYGPKLDWDDYNIQGVHWQVKEVPAGDPRIDDLYGKADFNNYVIWICEDMPYEERAETLFHETCHVITRNMKKLDMVIEENLRIFSVIVCDTVVRNEVRLSREEAERWAEEA